MRTKFFYALLALCLSVCAFCFTSCDDDDDTTNYYTIGIQEMNVSGSLSAYLEDGSRIENAIVGEFGTMSFQIQGKTADADKEVKSRFEKAVQNITLKGGWTGHVTYEVDRATSDSKAAIASKKFVSPDGE